MILSIIVPVYNTEKYLVRCVESLENQDIPHDRYEIVLINDGSTDDSLFIANQLSGKYNNIIVKTQINKGQAAARNVGLSVAKGEYIWFVDSDDYIKCNCLNELLSVMEKHKLEIFGFRFSYMSNDKQIFECNIQKVLLNVIRSGKFYILNGFYPGTSVCYIYLSQYLKEHNLIFKEGIVNEDVEIMSRIMSYASRAMFTDQAYYIACENVNSTTHSISNLKKCTLDVIKVAKYIKDFSKELDDIQISEHWRKLSNSIVCITLYDIIKDKKKRDFLSEAVYISKKENMYPIEFPLNNWKYYVIALIINRCSFIKLLLNI